MQKTDKLIDWKANEKKDANRDGIDDRIEGAIPDVAAGSHKLAERLLGNHSTDPGLAGGDVDAVWEMAESQGDDLVAGSMATPEQNDVEANAAAMGISYAADETLRVGEKERERDKHRWELDPASSEDYKDRVRDEARDEARDEER